jgi:signal transduction histidine kinase
VTLGARVARADAQQLWESRGHHSVGVDLLVGDEGQGIEEAHRDLVFSRFWHGSGPGSTGLGLYVVKGLVEAHGGRVVVERSPAGGAQFRLSLPSEPPEYLA